MSGISDTRLRAALLIGEPLYLLTDFVNDLRPIVARARPPMETLVAMTPAFKRLLSDESFLSTALARCAPHGDEACLYRDPHHGFVVLARGIGQAQDDEGGSHAAMPHDHGPLWAVYGLYRGAAHMQRYTEDAMGVDEPSQGFAWSTTRPPDRVTSTRSCRTTSICRCSRRVGATW